MVRFIRQSSQIKKRIKGSWRSPRGVHSKMRHKLKGHSPVVSIGYRSKKKKRHESQSIRVIKSPKELECVAEGTKIIISGKTGLKKKIEILKLLQKKKKNEVQNVKNIDDFLKKIEEGKEEEKKLIKKDEKKEKVEEKKDLGLAEKIESEEDIKKKEKEEKDRVLTKKKLGLFL